MTEAANASPARRGWKSALHPILVAPAAITVAAQYKDVFDFGHSLAAMLERWVVFWRAVWSRLGQALPDWVTLTDEPAALDAITLWLTLSATIGILPMILRWKSEDRGTVLALVKGQLSMPQAIAGSSLAITASIILIAAPYAGQLFELLRNTFVELVEDPSQVLIRALFLLVGIYLVVTVALASAGRIVRHAQDLYEVDFKDRLSVPFDNAEQFWAGSAFFLIAGATRISFAGQIPTAMAVLVSLVILLAVISRRTALPLVQAALMVAAVFVLDSVIQFLIDVYESTSQPH